MARRVVVEAPASSANLGCGFDVFALALGRPMDKLTLAKSESGLRLSVGGDRLLSEKPETNVVIPVARAMLTEYSRREGVTMSLTKGVPVGKGLGSSGASSVAAAVGIDRLFGLNLSDKEIVGFAGIGEKAASGAAHYDNVAASLAGGFVIVRENHDFVRMEPPKSMAACLVTPELKLPKDKTKFARSILPRRVPIEWATAVAGAAGMMAHGFAVGSLDEIGEAMTESLVDRERSSIIPGFEHVRRAAASHDAAGVSISGAGPTLLALCESRASRAVLRSMIRAFASEGVKSEGFVTRVGSGCRVLEG